MIEYARNAPKKMDVDIFLLEYLVYIGTCTAQLSGEPGNCASLFVKRTFDKLSRMNHAQSSYECPPDSHRVNG